jgi:DNA-binding ferritin-like protein
LAYLTAYAAEMMNDLLKEANSMAERIVNLGYRAEGLAANVPLLVLFFSFRAM